MVFGEKFLMGRIWGESSRVWDFFRLIGGKVTGQSFRNLMVSLKLPSFTWVGPLVSAELKYMHQIIMYIPSEATSTLFYCWTIVSWLLFLCFCIPSLPWLATVWICLLEIWKGQWGWMKTISCNRKRILLCITILVQGTVEERAESSPRGHVSV